MIVKYKVTGGQAHLYTEYGGLSFSGSYSREIPPAGALSCWSWDEVNKAIELAIGRKLKREIDDGYLFIVSMKPLVLRLPKDDDIYNDRESKYN